MLARDVEYRVAHARVDVRHRQLVAAAHEVAHAEQQPLAERAARMEERKVFLLQSEQQRRHTGYRVAYRHLERRAARRRKAQRIGLAVDVAVEHDVGLARERRLRVAGHRDYRRADSFEIRDDVYKFVSLAAVAQEVTDVLAAYHAEVAVRPFRRVQEEGRNAERGECRRALAPYVARLAEPSDDDAPAAAADEMRRARNFIA